MKQQFVVTQTIRQADFPFLWDGRVKNKPSVKMLYPQKKLYLLVFS
jgi:hypothetical protein